MNGRFHRMASCQTTAVAAPLILTALISAACNTPAPPAPTLTAPATTTTIPGAPPPPPPPERVTYDVRFESTWSAVTHPTDFPDNAHYSRLIGATHTGGVSFWRIGELASAGIQAMAERGRTTPLDEEVEAAIASGSAEFVLRGDALATSPGTVSLSFDVTQRFSRVTLVTMVAPSPDWFVGVSGLALFDGNRWVDDTTVDLLAYDAGTDSGPTFESPDDATRPPAAIHLIAGYPIAAGAPPVPLARYVFTRRQN